MFVMDKSRLRPTGEVPLPVDRYPGRLAWGLGLLDPSHGAKIPGSSSRPSGCGGPRLARLEPQKGGASHPFRRGWATGKKHMSPKDVAAVGRWIDTTTLQKCYRTPDLETMQAVVLEPRRVVRVQA